MNPDERHEHWERVYRSKQATEVSWYQAEPTTSLEMIHRAKLQSGSRVIDVGGGASTLVDALLEQNLEVTVLDLSNAALQQARDRLGPQSDRVRWLAADITLLELPAQHFDFWHDRAVFHFLTDPADRSRYVASLRNALKPGGHVLLATFAPDGPSKCSGLPVMRYDTAGMLEVLGTEFKLLEERFEVHLTPGGGEQRFVYAWFEYAIH
jgi:ubiquinone/menaquinone biosynthesis C-methylase UbiE